MRWFRVRQSLCLSLLFLALSSTSFAVTIDPVASPTPTAELPLSGEVEPDAATISITVNQAEPTLISAGSTGRWSHTLVIPREGENLIRVAALDGDGAELSFAETSVILDTTAPETAITAHPSTITNLKSGSFSFASPDPAALFDCSLDGAPFTACASPAAFDFSGVADSEHLFRVRAKDAAGNVDATPAEYNWSIDTTAPGAPTVTGTTPTSDTTPTWSWTPGGGGNGTFRLKVGSGDLGSGTAQTNATTFTPGSALSEGSHTLFVQERDQAGNWSEAGSFAIVIDTTAPAAAVTGTPARYTSRTDAILTVGGAGVAAYRYGVDGAALSGEIPVATAIRLDSLPQGAHTVSVIGRDDAGNWQTEATVVDWTVDSVAPTVGAGGDRTANARFTQTATASDATAMTFAWSREAGPGTVSFDAANAISTNVSASADGSYTLRFTATDAAGNSAYSDFALVWDTAAPETSITSRPADPTNQKSGSIGFASPDSSASFECSSDGSAYAVCSSPVAFDFGGAADSAHTFLVRARDLAGNLDPTPAQAIWTIDTAPPGAPAVTGTTPNNDTTPTWSWTPGGGGSDAYRLKVDNSDLGSGAAQTGSTSFTPASPLSEGSHTLFVQERDAAGNWSASGSFTIEIDVTPPAATVAGAPPQFTRQSGATLTIGGVGVVAYRYRVDGAPYTQSETPVATALTLNSLAQGSHSVSVLGRDGAGNWQAEANATVVRWTVDSVAPTVGAGADRTVNAQFTQSATASDATALTFAWSKAAGPGTVSFDAANALSTNVSASTDGSYTLRFTATDAAGNSAYSDFALVWDTVPPTVDQAASFVDSTHVDVSFSETVVGADQADNYLADNALSVTGATLLPGGAYRLTTSVQTAARPYSITAGNGITDRAGNPVQSGSDRATFTRPLNSNRAPTVPVASAPANGQANLNEVTTLAPRLSVNASTDADGDPISYSFELSAKSDFSILAASAGGVTASGGSASWTVDAALADNTAYYWRALANDGYINSAYTATGTFFINTANEVPQGISISAPGDGTEVTLLAPPLSVSNASDPDLDSVGYQFEVATDSGFQNKVATTEVAAGAGGSTSWTVSPALGDNSWYYWRARARDQHGATGGWVTATFFSNTANDAPTAPTRVSPVSGGANRDEVTVLTPTLVCANAGDQDHDTLSYTFQIAAVASFNGPTLQVSPPVAEGSGTTQWTPAPLADNTTWYWRVKANDGGTDGPWSTTGTFFANTANNAPTPPTVQNPADNSRVASTAPVLTLNPAEDVDQDPLTYEFAVYSDPGLAPSSQVAGATEQNAAWTVDPTLQNLKTYYWTARAKDAHHYYSSWTPAKSFFVDDDGSNAPPTIAITKPGSAEPPINAYSGASYTISWQAADPDSDPAITLFRDNDDQGHDGTQIATGIRKSAPALYTWDTSSLADGTYYIYAVIVDESQSAYSAYAGPVVIDRTPPAPPTVTAATPTNSTAPAWSWSSGGGGSGSYRYKLDDGNLASGSVESVGTSFSPAAALAQGNHTLYVQEKDQAGNWSTTGSFTVTIDTAPPSVTQAACAAPAASYKAGAPLEITVSFSEPVSSVTGLVFTLNSGGMLSTGPLTRASSFTGVYTVGAGESTASLSIASVTGTIADQASNAATNPAVPAGKNLDNFKTIIVDTTAPLADAGPDRVTNTLFTQSATASDSSPLSYAWSKVSGPGEIVFGTPNALSSAVSASKDGSYLLAFTATDRAGNATTSELQLVWDTVPPAVVSATSASGSGAYRTGQTVDVTLDFSEPVSTTGLVISLNSGGTLATGPLSGVISYSGSYAVAQGENAPALSVSGVAGTVTDAAGNAKEKPSVPAGRNISEAKAIAIDTTAPDTAWVQTPANPSNAKSGSFSFGSPESAAGFECSMDSGSFAACTSPYGFNFSALADGAHSFAARARDAAGNLDPSPAQYSWTIKTDAPTATLSGAPEAPTKATALSLAVGGAEVTAYRFQLDGAPFSAETPVAAGIELTSLGEGEHTVRVVGRDAAGNWQAEAEATVAGWTVDLTPPSFQEVSTLPDGSFTNKNELNVAGVVGDLLGVPALSIEVAVGGTLYSDAVQVEPSGAFSYLLKERLGAGSNQIRLVAQDLAGNYSVNARNISYDPTAPRLTIGAPPDNSTRNLADVEVSGNVDESVASVEVQAFDCQPTPVLRSAQLASISGNGFTATQRLAPGCNTIVVTATDLAGNRGADKRSVAYDDQKPTLAVSAPGADLRTQVGTMEVAGTVSDAMSAVAVTVEVNGETFTPAVTNGAFSQQVRFTQSSVYHIVVKATDAGGNEAVVQRNVIYAKPSNGDINNDGRVDILDCLIALRISAGLLAQSDNDLLYGDVAPLINGVPVSDGVIDVGDAAVILKAVSGLVTLN